MLGGKEENVPIRQQPGTGRVCGNDHMPRKELGEDSILPLSELFQTSLRPLLSSQLDDTSLFFQKRSSGKLSEHLPGSSE